MLALLGAFSDKPAGLQERFEANVPDQVRLTRADRDDLLRTYAVRRTSLEKHGIDLRGIDSLLSRLAKHPDPVVWGFVLTDEEATSVGFVNEDSSTLVGLLALLRRAKADDELEDEDATPKHLPVPRNRNL